MDWKKKRTRTTKKAVEQIKNGIVVKCVLLAYRKPPEKAIFSATAICKVCKGKGNLHKVIKWRYKK